MCVLYDFISRNHRELTVRKGEMVDVSFSDMIQVRLYNQWPPVRPSHDSFIHLSTCRCWTQRSSGGEWGTSRARRDSCPTTSCRLQTNNLTRCQILVQYQPIIINHFINKTNNSLSSSQLNEVSPVLTKKSRPEEVKAWLEDKGFSKM